MLLYRCIEYYYYVFTYYVRYIHRKKDFIKTVIAIDELKINNVIAIDECLLLLYFNTLYCLNGYDYNVLLFYIDELVTIIILLYITLVNWLLIIILEYVILVNWLLIIILEYITLVNWLLIIILEYIILVKWLLITMFCAGTGSADFHRSIADRL